VTTPDPRPVGSTGDPLSVGLPPTGTTAGPTPTPTSPDRTTPAETPTRERHAGRTIGRSLALILLLFVTVVLVLFVMFNTQTVDISLVFADVNAPLVLALLIAAALGGLLVALAGAVLRARRRNR
jgi:uncharacterized integral membrane protein